MSDVPVVKSPVNGPKLALPQARPLASPAKTALPQAKPLTTDELAALLPAAPSEPDERGLLPQAKPLTPEELAALSPVKSRDAGENAAIPKAKPLSSFSSTILPQAKPLAADDPYALPPAQTAAIDPALAADLPIADATDLADWTEADAAVGHARDDSASRWTDEVESITIRVRAMSALAVAGVGLQFSTAIATAAQFVIEESPAWAISMVLHAVAVVTMAMVTATPAIPKQQRQHLVVTPPEEEEFVERIVDHGIDQIDERLMDHLDEDREVDSAVADLMPEEGQDNFQSETVDEPDATDSEADIGDFVLGDIPKSDLLSAAGLYGGSTLSARTNPADRAKIAQREGATGASERTVQEALRWLAIHQMEDGGWSFNHNQCTACRGKCRNDGTHVKARNAATAMALLPFLGMGCTHKEGPYKQTVRNGLAFLASRMNVKQGHGGSLHEDDGRMYSQGLGAIVLCESYAMTHDRALKDYAQQALNFICWAQDPKRGGWRYEPRTSGDTSVVGWQLMALKSGCMAKLTVKSGTIRKVNMFFDYVQKNNGAAYVYLDPKGPPGEATTAIGLLCRMYLGWKKDNPALQEGVRFLCMNGPSGNNLYYNYYATQVLRHREGEEWNRWNRVMRDQLVHGQAKLGHEKGSWYLSGDHGANAGGRLYCTAMATMILEIYYRNMPIYRQESVDKEFAE